MLNKIILQGRLTKDFELRYTQSNTAVAGGTLAVQRSRKDAGGKYPSDFIDVVLWSMQQSQYDESTKLNANETAYNRAMDQANAYYQAYQQTLDPTYLTMYKQWLSKAQKY